MEQYIPKYALVAEIERRKNQFMSQADNFHSLGMEEKRDHFAVLASNMHSILSFLDTLEVKEMDLELITGWFDHIAQIADDRMTLTGQRMTDSHALDEIKCIAKNSSEFITKHYKAQKGK